MSTESAEKAEQKVDRGYIWCKIDERPYPGADLAALRRGLGREAGSVPQMWRYYRSLSSDESKSLGAERKLEAEHAALTLYGFHQQSEPHNVHQPKRSIGSALRTLRLDDRFSTEAVERRVERAVAATDLTHLVRQLRGLIGLMKSLSPTPGFDYEQLIDDFTRWQDPATIGRVRRRWGQAYLGSPSMTTSQPKEH